MKKFISVLLAILMVVAVMPFAIFAEDADEGYTREKNTAHVCHPVDEDGNLVLDAVDMSTVTVAFTKAAKDAQVIESFLTDGNKATATRLPVGTTAKLTLTFANVTDLGTLTLTVNGKGKINPGEEFETEVIKDSAHNLKVKVVAYNGTTKVYEDTEEVDTSKLTDLVVDIFEKATKIEITTVGATSATAGGPRLWEVSATTVKGEEDYNHTWEKTITKLPSLPEYDADGETLINDGKGTYTQACSACGAIDADAEGKTNVYEIPAMTIEDLNGGILGLDHIESFVEETGKFDAEGNPILDDDGNPYTVTTNINSKPEHLFDGNHGVSHMWTANGNYWYIGKDGKLTVTLKDEVLVSYVKILATTNWTQLNITFYNGKTEVAKMTNGPDGNAFGTADARWYDLTDYLEISGKYIDKIVIDSPYERAVNYSKWGELEIGIHEHVYTEADIKANGTAGTGEDICKYTHDATCIECHTKANDAISYLHDVKVNTVREVECGTSIYYDTCNATDCKYNSGEYTVAGTGAHEFNTMVAQNTYATCGAEGKATFVCSVCKERQESSVENLVGKKLAADLVGVYGVVAAKDTVIDAELIQKAVRSGAVVFPVAAVDSATNASLTVNYTLAVDITNGDLSVKSVGAAPSGSHTLGYKNYIPSTYTTHGVDVGYCTVCNANMKDFQQVADFKSLDTVVRVNFNGFTLRTSEFEGIRATFTVNKKAADVIEANDEYSVRIWVVATNAAGETSEVQIYGAGAKNWIDNNYKTSVVVKDVEAEEVITFQLKISVKDKLGNEQLVIRDVDSTTLAAVKAAGK